MDFQYGRNGEKIHSGIPGFVDITLGMSESKNLICQSEKNESKVIDSFNIEDLAKRKDDLLLPRYWKSS